MSQTTLHIAEQDNVMVALRAIAGGTVVDGVTVASDVPAGHKIATRPIPARADGPEVRLPDRRRHAGHRARRARSLPQPDQHAARRLRSVEARRAPAAAGDAGREGDVRRLPARRRPRRHPQRDLDRQHRRLREQRRRADRRGGAQGAGERRGDWGSVDGVHAFPHQFGCSQLGDDLDLTQKILAGLVRHPNAGGVLILGLGCENNQMKLMLESVGAIAPERVAVLQRAGRQRRGRGGDRAHPPAGGVRGQGEARADPGQGADPGDEVRRQRRAVGHHREPAGRQDRQPRSRRRAAPCC